MQAARQVEHVPPQQPVMHQLGPEEDRLYLGPFYRPVVPVAREGVQRLPDSDGWILIDRLGALECLLRQYGMLADVPEQHEAAWVAACSQVLRRWREAETEEEADRALKWVLFLPQSLLRRPRRRGLKGRRAVAARFCPGHQGLGHLGGHVCGGLGLRGGPVGEEAAKSGG